MLTNFRPQSLPEYLLFAVNFAAQKHRDQRRKNKDRTPYINHPIAVAQILSECGVTDIEVWIGAILHDTVEDTDTTLAEVRKHFGDRVAQLVSEVSDDKSLGKAERKRLQIEHTPTISAGAKVIKMADKLHNLTSFTESIPLGWSARRVQGYFVWSMKVIEGCRGINENLEKRLDNLFKTGTFECISQKWPCVPTSQGNANQEFLDDLLKEYLKDMSNLND